MLLIGQKQNGGTIEVPVGESFQIQLSENPTTGYRWHLQADGSPALHLLQDTFQAPPDRYGGGGARHWTFAADRPGLVTVRYELRRSWEPAAVETFSLTVDIKTS
jgi:inhibitor of cysteine peptidase